MTVVDARHYSKAQANVDLVTGLDHARLREYLNLAVKNGL